MSDHTVEQKAEMESRWGAAMAAAQSSGSGDPEARAAYEKMLSELLPVIRRIVRTKLFDATYVEDVVQNALLSIHRARATYRPERAFGPWLRAVVRNALIDWFRESKRRADREVLSEVMEEFATAAVSLAREVHELSPALSDALATLPEKQREAVSLIQVEGLTVAEAAVRALDPDWRTDYNRRARQWTDRYHHPNNVIRDHLSIYRRVLEEHDRQGDRTQTPL